MSGAAGPARGSRALDLAILFAVLLAAWQLVYLWAGDVAMTSPLGTARYAVETLASAEFWPHVWATLSAFAIALVLASVGGIVMGALFGYHRLSGEVAEPILVGIYSIPKVTLYPVILLFFGIGIAAEVAFGAIHGVIPITLFTMNAVRNIRPVHLRTARVMRLPLWTLVRTILLPATVPEVFTGLRVGFSLTLIGTLLSEMFGSRRGIGFMLMNAIGLHNMDIIMSLTLLLVLFAGTVNAALLWADRRLHRGA